MGMRVAVGIEMGSKCLALYWHFGGIYWHFGGIYWDLVGILVGLWWDDWDFWRDSCDGPLVNVQFAWKNTIF